MKKVFNKRLLNELPLNFKLVNKKNKEEDIDNMPFNMAESKFYNTQFMTLAKSSKPISKIIQNDYSNDSK